VVSRTIGAMSLSKIWWSSAGQKVIAGVTGVALATWLFVHAAGNLTLFGGAEVIDRYAASLKAFGPILWAARLLLLFAFVAHVSAVTRLAKRARLARGASIGPTVRRSSTLAARSMRIGGGLLLVFIVFHLGHLTFGALHPDFRPEEPSHNLLRGLASTPVAAIYVGAALLVALHLVHGLRSALFALGRAAPKKTDRRALVLTSLAVVLALAFASVPASIWLGAIQ
jgi:succinate dehydrogenase / fumarate reductase, cytochrome b subunit